MIGRKCVPEACFELSGGVAFFVSALCPVLLAGQRMKTDHGNTDQLLCFVWSA